MPETEERADKRAVHYGSRFKKDFRREKKGLYRRTLEDDLLGAVKLLANDLPLPARMADHALSGNWKGFRDCHIHPDLVLIYRKTGSAAKPPSEPEKPKLELARLGSHSELGL